MQNMGGRGEPRGVGPFGPEYGFNGTQVPFPGTDWNSPDAAAQMMQMQVQIQNGGWNGNTNMMNGKSALT